MPNAGTITVGMVASTRQWTAGINRAKKDLDGFKGYLASSAKQVGAAFAGVVSVQALKSGLSELKSTLLDIDDLATQALKLGTTARDLDAMRFAAELLDTSTSALEKSMLRMGRSIYDAREGSKEQKVAFDQLGLSLDSLLSMKPADQFSAIASSLSRVSNETLQAALAQKVFGKGGAELLPIIRSGIAEFDKLRAEALATNAVLGDTTAAERFDEAHKRMQTEARRLREELAINAEPFAETWLRGMTRISQAVRGVDQDIKNLRIAGAAAQLTGPAKELFDLRIKEKQLKDLLAGQDPRSAAIDKYQSQLKELRKEIDRILNPQTYIQQRSSEDFLNQWRATLGTNTPFRDAFKSFKDLVKVGKSSFEDLARAGDVAAFKVGAAWREQHREYLANLKAEADAIRESIKSASMLFDDELARVGELVKAGALSVGDARKYLTDQADQLGLNGSSGPPSISSADIAGSASAANAIAEAIARARQPESQTDDIQKRIEKAVNDANKESEKQTKLLKDIKDNLSFSSTP